MSEGWFSGILSGSRRQLPGASLGAPWGGLCDRPRVYKLSVQGLARCLRDKQEWIDFGEYTERRVKMTREEQTMERSHDRAADIMLLERSGPPERRNPRSSRHKLSCPKVAAQEECTDADVLCS